jgi:hypothetical protein
VNNPPSAGTPAPAGTPTSPSATTPKGRYPRPASEVKVVDSAALSQVTEESRHIARLLRREGMKVLGLCPASDEVAVLPAAVQVGVALSEQSGAPVALVEANARWTAVPVPAGQGRITFSGSLLLTRWLAGDRLALLSLPPDASIGAGLIEMERLVRSGRSMFEQVLIDLTGLERLGEHLAAAAMCDALVFVARAGVTTEEDLLRLTNAFVAHRTLGVVLVGSR